MMLSLNLNRFISTDGRGRIGILALLIPALCWKASEWACSIPSTSWPKLKYRAMIV